MIFLRQKFKWTNLEILGGIESRMAAKPDVVMYFDADDEESPINNIAARIENLLPDYELSKVSPRAGPIRGVCVLVYPSPMKSTFGGMGSPEFVASMPPAGIEFTSGNANRQFSVQQLREVLEFQESQEGRAQYEAQDNPIHRMFGGMM